jgi:type IV pilus assembly protein PilQ
MKKSLIILFSLIALYTVLFAQTNTLNNSSLVRNLSPLTIQKDTDFQAAIKIIESLSIKEANRNIVNVSSYKGGIPVQINSMTWVEALEILVKSIGLDLDSKPGVYIISDRTEASLLKQGPDEYSIHDKMVKINATFLRVDKKFTNEAGINWSSLFRGQVEADVSLTTELINNGVSIGGTGRDGGVNVYDSSWGKTSVSIDALLRFIEENKKGTVLARPTITVLDGQEGFVQVGDDFSVKQLEKDDNTIDVFYSVGIILRVTPSIIEEDNFTAVYLKAAVEKSNVNPGASVIITKSSAATAGMFYDGEETTIAGLVDNDTEKERGGIPVLKNIPWYFGGFLFGWSRTITTAREMVVIIKVEIVDTALDRIRSYNDVKDEFEKMKEDYKDIEKDLIQNKY